MLQQIYKDQLLVFRDSHPTMPKKLKKFSTVYVEVYDKIKKDILHKGARDMTVDPQVNTIKDTYDLDELEKIVNCLFDEGTVAGDRALAMSLWAHSSVGRGDDVRLFYLADLVKPSLIPAVGEYIADQQVYLVVFPECVRPGQYVCVLCTVLARHASKPAAARDCLRLGQMFGSYWASTEASPCLLQVPATATFYQSC
jgi:hypothetical protein